MMVATVTLLYLGCCVACALFGGLTLLVGLALLLVECVRAQITFTRQLIAYLPLDYVKSLRRTFDDVKFAFTEH